MPTLRPSSAAHNMGCASAYFALHGVFVAHWEYMTFTVRRLEKLWNPKLQFASSQHANVIGHLNQNYLLHPGHMLGDAAGSCLRPTISG
jgi:hypothetical protein